jgi:hypothetical protein
VVGDLNAWNSQHSDTPASAVVSLRMASRFRNFDTVRSCSTSQNRTLSYCAKESDFFSLYVDLDLRTHNGGHCVVPT